MLSEHSLQRRLLNPERAVLFAEVWTAAQSWLRPRDLDVLRWRFLDGQTYREIGEANGVCSQRALQQVSEALRRLQLVVRYGRVWKQEGVTRQQVMEDARRCALRAFYRKYRK